MDNTRTAAPTNTLPTANPLDALEQRIIALQKSLTWWKKIHNGAPQWLGALGIDHPDLRFELASRYIRKTRSESLRAIGTDTMTCLVLWRAKNSAAEDDRTEVNEADLHDARLWAARNFGVAMRKAVA